MWRPPRRIRPIAIGVLRRGDDILAMIVRDDQGAVKGWRPPGGAIEFGESAAAALQREMMEEFGCPVAEPRLLTVHENIFDHHGAQGHEIVFVFETRFIDQEPYRRENFAFVDGDQTNEARWAPLADFRSGRERLFPTGLIAAL